MTKMRNYTFVAGCIAMAKKGQVGGEPWRPSALVAEPKEAALRCFGGIRRETMEREGLIGSAKGTRIMHGVFVERWVSRKKTKKLAANKTCAYCGEAFYAEPSMQVFCSNLCDKKVDKRGKRIRKRKSKATLR
jgi:hypothetical protein